MTASKIGGWALRVYASVAAFALTSCGSNVQIAPGLTRDAGVDVVRQLGLHPSSGSESVLFSFTGAGGQLPGANPTSGLTLIEKNGENYLYGAAPMGGNEKVGTIYDLHGKAHHYVAGTLRAFSGKDGAFPYGSVSVPDPNGDNIYETTESGGRSDDGALIELILSNNKYKRGRSAAIRGAHARRGRSLLWYDSRGRERGRRNALRAETARHRLRVHEYL
jgi:hypothetical protein